MLAGCSLVTVLGVGPHVGGSAFIVAPTGPGSLPEGTTAVGAGAMCYAAPRSGHRGAAAGLAVIAGCAGAVIRRHRAVQRRAVKAPVVIEGSTGIRDANELNRYRVAFAAEGTEAWRPARVVAIEAGSSSTLVSLEVETSREYVALQRAYRAPGQHAQVRFNGSSEEVVLPVASPPPSLTASTGQLWRLKGDIYAGETKKEADTQSLPILVDVLVPNSQAAVKPGDEVRVGPFTDEGIDLRAIMARFQAPVLAIICDGSTEAVCTLRAAMEAENCASELQLRERAGVLLFCGPTSGLPSTLTTWLSATQDRFLLALTELDADPLQSWAASAEPNIRGVVSAGERVGALVLGSPEFVKAISDKLSREGVELISSSGSVHPLARVVEPEQI